MNMFLPTKKAGIWRRFLSFNRRPLPVPTLDYDEAYRMGLKEGYAEGLVDGVSLGLDAGTFLLCPPSIMVSTEPVDIC